MEPIGDSLITIRWDNDEGRIVYDLGGLDDYSAEAMVRQVADTLFERLPVPRDIDDTDSDSAEPADE